MVTAQTPHSADGPEMGYGQLLSILLRRFLWFGGAIVGALAIAFALTLKQEPVYRSSMQLLVEPNYRRTVDITGEETGTEEISQTDYATQLNLMRSNEFVAKTVEQLLEEYPELCNDSETLANCIEAFQGSLSLSQIVEDKTETRIFQAEFTAEDPDITQAFLATLSEVYLSYNEDQQEQRLEQGLALVNQQIAEIQGGLSASREELKQFRESENLIDPEQQALDLATTLNQIEQDQISIDNEYRDVQAQYGALQQQLKADPQTALVSSRLSQSSRYQQLLDALQETELALQERLALYAEADPGVQDLISKRKGQVTLLQEEAVRVLGGASAQLGSDESALLSRGQMGEIDLELVNSLVQSQVRLQSLEARQGGLVRAKQRLQGQLNQFPNLIAEFDRIQPEIETQQESLEQLLQLRQELSNQLAQGGFSWDVVAAPQPGEKVAPQPKQNLLLGLVAGVFVGGALAFGREAMDNVVRTSEELKKQATLPMLGVIPEIPARKMIALPTGLPDELPSIEAWSPNQWQPFRDTVDLIYKTIQLSSNQPLSSLMMTSALAGEGKTLLAIGLAVSAARSHQRVLLIDANWRHPSLHHQLNLDNEQGLSTLLQTNRVQAEQFNPVPVSLPMANTHIDVLPAGPTPSDPLSFLSSRQMQRLLSNAEASYDLVILDAPAIVGLPDGLQLASLCKGVLLVSRLDRITQADLMKATTLLSQVNTVGMVANGYREGGNSNGFYDEPGDRSKKLIEVPLASRNGFRSMLMRSSPWAQILAISAMGCGILSLPVWREPLQRAIEQFAEKANPNSCVTTTGEACESSEAVSQKSFTNLNSTAPEGIAHHPQWSNAP